MNQNQSETEKRAKLAKQILEESQTQTYRSKSDSEKRRILKERINSPGFGYVKDYFTTVRQLEIDKIVNLSDDTPWKNEKSYTYYDLLKTKVAIIKDLIEQPEVMLSSLELEISDLYPEVTLEAGEVIEL